MIKGDFNIESYKKILELIDKKTVSGEFLAKELKISRVAVWKKIKKLEKLGYKIEKSKHGYKLISKPDKLLPFEIIPYLKTKKLGRKYIYFEKINSTNIYVKDNKELEDGSVVVAEFQDSGKGRKGRRWVSPAYKGLYFSILLKRSIPITDILKLSLFFSFVIRNVLQKLISNEIFIKWPNDLYINNKKFGGILIETEIEGNEINRIIVGIGININATYEDLEPISDIATSLYIEEGKSFNRKELFINILEEIERNISNLSSSEIVKSVEDCLLWKNYKIKVLDEDLEGILIGLSENGALLLKTDEGIRKIYSGDLSIRKS